MWQRHRRCSSRELRTRYCRDHQYWYVCHLSVVFTLFSRLCARVCVCADSHELRSALTISLLLKIQTNSSPVFNILSFLPSNDHQRQSILFLFVFAAERIPEQSANARNRPHEATDNMVGSVGTGHFWNARRARRTDFLHSI